uniref:Putative secreted protein n=1 Tax=Panstrongylus lignarius TaxID=156445 RepID=A0A224Y0T9_9HEMI
MHTLWLSLMSPLSQVQTSGCVQLPFKQPSTQNGSQTLSSNSLFVNPSKQVQFSGSVQLLFIHSLVQSGSHT